MDKMITNKAMLNGEEVEMSYYEDNLKLSLGRWDSLLLGSNEDVMCISNGKYSLSIITRGEIKIRNMETNDVYVDEQYFEDKELMKALETGEYDPFETNYDLESNNWYNLELDYKGKDDNWYFADDIVFEDVPSTLEELIDIMTNCFTEWIEMFDEE